MKKIILLFSLLGLFSTSALADRKVVYTRDCRTEAMRALLDQVVAAHHAVMTEVICEAFAPVYEPVMVAPVYQEFDYSQIPVVDCVPGPIVGPCGCLY